MSLKKIALLSIGLSAISACGGIGDGSRPEELILLPVTIGLAINDEDLNNAPASTSITQCLGGNLGLFIRFTNGTVGDFTTRATWESRNPEIVQVSNFDLPVLDTDLLFTSGAMIPVSVGTATVDVTYNGLTSSIEVVVEPADLDSFRLTPATQVMAPRSSVRFDAVGNVDGVRDALINQFLTFDLQDTDDDTLQSNDSTVSAISASDNIARLRARFNAESCPVESLSASIQVADLESISLEQEEDFYSVGSSPDEQRMAVGYSQFLRITGRFGDVDLDGDGQADTQDLGPQAVTELAAEVTDPSDDEDAVVVSFGSPLFGRANQVVGTFVGSANITASFPGEFGPDGAPDTEDDGPATTSNTVAITVVGRDDDVDPLQDITVSPTSASITDAFGTQDFRARGVFVFGDRPRLSHDVSRHVVWSIVDPATEEDEADPVAFVSNFPNTNIAGRAQSLLDIGADPATVTVRAFRFVGLADTDPLDASDPLDIQRDATLSLSAPAQ